MSSFSVSSHKAYYPASSALVLSNVYNPGHGHGYMSEKYQDYIIPGFPKFLLIALDSLKASEEEKEKLGNQFLERHLSLNNLNDHNDEFFLQKFSLLPEVISQINMKMESIQDTKSSIEHLHKQIPEELRNNPLAEKILKKSKRINLALLALNITLIGTSIILGIIFSPIFLAILSLTLLFRKKPGIPLVSDIINLYKSIKEETEFLEKRNKLNNLEKWLSAQQTLAKNKIEQLNTIYNEAMEEFKEYKEKVEELFNNKESCENFIETCVGQIILNRNNKHYTEGCVICSEGRDGLIVRSKRTIEHMKNILDFGRELQLISNENNDSLGDYNYIKKLNNITKNTKVEECISRWRLPYNKWDEDEVDDGFKEIVL